MWSDTGQTRRAIEITLMEHRLNVGLRGTWHRPGLSLPPPLSQLCYQIQVLVNRFKREVIEIESRPGALKECESFPVSEVTEPSLHSLKNRKPTSGNTP